MISLLFAVCCVISSAVQGHTSKLAAVDLEDDNSLVLKNNLISLHFASAENGFSLFNICNTIPNGEKHCFLQPQPFSSIQPMLWSADIRDHTSYGYYINNIAGGDRSYEIKRSQDTTTLHLKWSNFTLNGQDYYYRSAPPPVVNVIVSISLTDGSPMTDWTATIDWSGGVCLWRFALIKVVGLGSTNQKDYFISNLRTGSVSSKTAGGYSYVYPSSGQSMQFGAMYHQDDPTQTSFGLYYATHDPSSYYKVFSYQSDTYQGLNKSHSPTGYMEITHIPENSCGYSPYGQITSYTIPYAVVLGVYIGDWWDAAQIYREWALNSAQWLQNKPPPQGSDIQLWVNTCWQDSLVNCTNGNPDVAVPMVLKMKELFGVSDGQMACHYYCWHQVPFDSDLPQYFPAKPGFDQAVKTLQAAGIKVAPYINARVFDMNCILWNQSTHDAASKQAAPRFLPPSLQLYQDSYGVADQNFAVMCPYTAYWQNMISGITSKLINEYGVQGVYIDQVASSQVSACSDTTHNHSIGGGNYWFTGYQKLFTQVKSTANHNPFIMSESNSEVYMKNVDGYLVELFSCGSKPIFNTVYDSTVVNLLGRIFYRPDLIYDPTLWDLKMAQMFVYGLQLGWFSLGGEYGVYDLLVSPEYKAQVSYIKTLIAYRVLGQQKGYFSGRLLRDLPPKWVNASAYLFGSCSYDALLASVWGSPASSQSTPTHNINILDSVEESTVKRKQDVSFSDIGIIITNPSATVTHHANFTLDLDMYMFTSSNKQMKYQINRLEPPNKVTTLGTFDTRLIPISVHVAPHDVTLLQIILV